MQFYWTYIGCDTSHQASIATASRDRQAELEAKAELVGGGHATPVVVRVERADVSPQWSMQAAIYAPQASASAEARADEIIEALDRLIGGLSQQIDEQAARPLMVTVRRHGLQGFVAVLESLRRDGASGEFMAVLAPVLDSLSPYICRELRTRRALGEIPAGQTGPQEIRDEVLVKAWESFPDRPSSQALDTWLIGLIDETFEQLAQPLAERSLDERESLTRDQSRESETFESVERASETDTIALAQLIADQSDGELWDRLDVQGRQMRLDRLLQRLPRAQRNALMLQAVNGFHQAEIAELQSRSSEAVAKDLAAAKHEARRMLTEEDYLDIAEDLTLQDLQRPRRSHRT